MTGRGRGRWGVAVASLAALVVGLAFCGWRLAAFEGDPTSFVVAGGTTSHPDELPEGFDLVGVGYDGQFFYRLARSPLSTDDTAAGVTFDSGPYRQQRIVYPAIAWVGSAGGQPSLVPWSLIAVNLVALAVAAGAAAAHAQRARRPWWWGLACIPPGVAVSLSRDLSEVVAVALVLVGILGWESGRWSRGSVSWTLAALARETTLVVPVAHLLVAVWQRDWRRARWLSLPPLTWLSWQALLTARWGDVPVLSGRGNLGVPFQGLARTLVQTDSLAQLLLALAVLGMLGLGLMAVVGRAGDVSVRLAFVMSALLLVSLNSKVWVEADAFLRASAEACALAGVLILTASVAAMRAAGLAVAASATALAASAKVSSP